MVSDKNLIERVLIHKDRHAFDQLIKRHQSTLRYSLRQWTCWDEALADDLAQDTFLRAYQSLSKFRFESTFSTWLYRIAYRIFLDHQKSASTRHLEYVGDDWQEEAGHSESEPSDQADLHRDLARAMQALSPDQRAAVHLHLHRQYSHQEISDIMEIPLGTVKTHINRGRQLLAEALEDWRGE
jgi:RNA polymerase sigma-70 factor (ECF subfamily)